jgi:catechol 2,3-dioxygenase
MNMPALPPDSRIGVVRLRVRDLEAMVAFYTGTLAFSVLDRDGGSATLGTADREPLLALLAAPDAPARLRGSTGLYHVAYRVPTRKDLGAMIARIHEREWPFEGFADHSVSEAAYLVDPEGNGIEVYADRPRQTWRTVDGELFMSTESLDVPSLIFLGGGPAPRLPGGTDVGHVHLQVSSLEKAEAFYRERVGFDVTTRRYPGALFMSAGGYHHHVACNVWGGVGAQRPPEGSLGLVSFEVVVPSEPVRREILDGAAEGTIHDADQVGVSIVAG